MNSVDVLSVLSTILSLCVGFFQRDHGKIVARLIDDTGLEEDDRKVFFFSMKHPLWGQRHSSEMALSGMEIDPPGGLLRVKHGSHRDVVIVSASLPVKSFSGSSSHLKF